VLHYLSWNCYCKFKKRCLQRWQFFKVWILKSSNKERKPVKLWTTVKHFRIISYIPTQWNCHSVALNLQFFLHLTFFFNHPNITSVLNLFQLRFSSVLCLKPLLSKATINRDFTACAHRCFVSVSYRNPFRDPIWTPFASQICKQTLPTFTLD
jgi:hypothetical protein